MEMAMQIGMNEALNIKIINSIVHMVFKKICASLL